MPSFTRTLARNGLFLFVLGPAIKAADQAPVLGDTGRGSTLFQQGCAVCHAGGGQGQGQAQAPVAAQGPSLAGVMGRRAASLPNFTYSKAMEGSHLTWDSATLDRFLSAPSEVVPGSPMVVPVANPTDRRDLIAFIATLRPAPIPIGRESPVGVPRVRTPNDWQNDSPGAHHQVRVKDLPAPYATKSVGNNPRVTDQPPTARLSVPPGFQVKLFASDPSGPRLMRTAPNGDIFVADTRSGQVRVLRTVDGADAPSENKVFANHLVGPFGIAFFPQTGEPRWVYVANLNSIVRFPYRSGDLVASGPPETIVPQLTDSTAGHSTRDIGFSLDGRRMFIAVGSGSNVGDGMATKSPAEIREWEATHARGSSWGFETHRANVLETDPEGKQPLKIFATGIRNPVGLTVQPVTGEVWVSTNERDGLGDDLVPDYITHVKQGGYYGWPWYYMGNHEDPRHAGARPDLAGQAIVPDVPVQAHSAALQHMFYPANATGPSAFPAEYRGEIFAAFHGSWNRTGRTGSKVVRVRLKNGVATGEYEDFLTGFVIDDAQVWGRPVGVTVARDGALIVSDDGNGTIWRVSYTGR